MGSNRVCSDVEYDYSKRENVCRVWQECIVCDKVLTEKTFRKKAPHEGSRYTFEHTCTCDYIERAKGIPCCLPF